MTYEQYEALGTLLGRAAAAIRWAVGDWLAFGEDRFGELAAQAAEALSISPEGRMELIRVRAPSPGTVAACRSPGRIIGPSPDARSRRGSERNS